MTSAIISSTIDADFPIAGQDNDSQGFRDNFQIIKDGLSTAGAEITVLQNSTAKTDADNDFNGNVIDNAQTNRLYGTVYTNTTTALTNVSLNNGEYQDITVGGNHTVTFVDWPETGLYAKIKLALKSNGAARTVTFATEAGGVIKKEITQALATAIGADRAASVFNIVTTSRATDTATIYTDRPHGLVVGQQVNVSCSNSAFNGTNITLLTGTTGRTVVYANAGINTANASATGTVSAKVIAGNLSFLKSNLTNSFQENQRLFGTGLTGEIVVTAVTDLTGASVSLTVAPITKTYTAISSGAFVTTSATSVGVLDGDRVTISDVTGITGLVTTETYYAYGATSSGFYIAASYADAIGGTPVAGLTGSFAGTATATLSNMTGSNLVTVNSSTGMYTGMPIAFTGVADFGGITRATDYYVTVVDSTHIRLSSTLNGDPITLVAGSGTLTIVPRVTLAISFPSQISTSGAGLTITTSDNVFPTPFTVDSDINKVKLVEAWTADGGATIFLKYLGEFA
jgi:hypothetical protein